MQHALSAVLGFTLGVAAAIAVELALCSAYAVDHPFRALIWSWIR